MIRKSRRQFLRVISAGGLAGLAGCSSTDSGSGDGGQSTQTSGGRTETATDTPETKSGSNQQSSKSTGVASVDWPMRRHDAQNTGYVPEATPPVDSVTEKWRISSEWMPAPIAVNGTVYVDTSDSIVAYDADTGEEQWEKKAGSFDSGHPAYAEGRIFQGFGVNLTARDAADGSKLWQFRTHTGEAGSPFVEDGQVYVVNDAGYLYVTDLANEQDVGEADWLSNRGSDLMAVDDGTMYLTDRLDLLTMDVEDENFDPLTRMEDAPTDLTEPALADNTLYFAGAGGETGGHVYAVDASDGSELWHAEIDEETWDMRIPCVTDEAVYVASKQGRIYGIDIDDGSRLWQSEVDGKVKQPPAVTDEAVYVGSRDSHLYALDAENGSELWRFRTGDEVTEPPVVADEAVYVTNNDGELYALTEG